MIHDIQQPPLGRVVCLASSIKLSSNVGLSMLSAARVSPAECHDAHEVSKSVTAVTAGQTPFLM